MENPLTRIIRGGRKSSRLTPDGLRITEFPAPVTRLVRLYGLSGSYAQLYASQPNVRAVVNDIARECAELSLKMFMKDPRGPLLADTRIEVDHPMMDLLAEPEPGLSPFRFWWATFSDIGIYDIAYWRMIGTPPAALVRIPPDAVIANRDPYTGKIKSFKAMSTGETISAEELIVFWGYDPSINHGNIPPLETLRRTLAEEAAASQDREHRWSNSLRKDGIIEQDVQAMPMSDEALQSFITDAENALSGAQNSYTPFVMLPGMRWRDAEWSPKEMEYLNARKLNRIEVAAQYHYPAAKVLAAPSGADPDAATLQYFYTSTLPPYLSRVESEVEVQLLAKFELLTRTRRAFYVEFNLDAKMRGNFEQQAQVMATTAGGPVVTVNEARARLNLPPIEGGDKIFVPMNSMLGGGPQASPYSPTDTPAVGLNPVGTTPTPLPGRSPALPAGAVSLTDAQVKEVLSPAATNETIETILAKHDANTARSKAIDAHVSFMREARARFEERHAKMFEKFFGRQLNAVKGGKREIASKRWNRELADDLYGLALQTVEHIGAYTAKMLQGQWSTDRTGPYLRESSDAKAQAINEATARRLDEDGTFAEGRAMELAVSHTTFAMNWAVTEAANQNETDIKKTWVTTSEDPRPSHAKLNGTTVGFDETFDNGLRFPGDNATGNADEVANCRCILSVSV